MTHTGNIALKDNANTMKYMRSLKKITENYELF